MWIDLKVFCHCLELCMSLVEFSHKRFLSRSSQLWTKLALMPKNVCFMYDTSMSSLLLYTCLFILTEFDPFMSHVFQTEGQKGDIYICFILCSPHFINEIKKIIYLFKTIWPKQWLWEHSLFYLNSAKRTHIHSQFQMESKVSDTDERFDLSDISREALTPVCPPSARNYTQTRMQKRSFHLWQDDQSRIYLSSGG